MQPTSSLVSYAVFSALALALIVAACGGATEGSPEDAVREKIQAVIDGDRSAYRAALDPGALTLSVDERNDNYSRHRAAFEGCRIESVKRSGSGIGTRVDFRLDCSGSTLQCQTFPERIGGRWYGSISVPSCYAR